MSHKEEIELCTSCNGKGVKYYTIAGHNSTTKAKTCSCCEGSGRLLKVTEVTYEPWHSEEI